MIIDVDIEGNQGGGGRAIKETYCRVKEAYYMAKETYLEELAYQEGKVNAQVPGNGSHPHSRAPAGTCPCSRSLASLFFFV